MSTLKYKVVIFDLDDTLFDYQQTELASLLNTCKVLNIQIDKKNIYKLYKEANNKAKSFIGNLITGEDFDNFRNLRASLFLSSINSSFISTKAFVTLQLKYSEKGILIPEVYETLQAIYKKIKIIIATNGSTYPRLHKVENSEIAPFIYKFYSSEGLGVQKPNPEFFLTILNDNSPLKTDDVIVVGNEIKTDVIGALNSKLNCIYFKFNDNPISITNEKIKVIDKFSQILNHI